MPLDPRLSRRHFLGSSAKNAAGVAAGMVGLSAAVHAEASETETDSTSPAERLAIGVIGLRQQGHALAGKLASIPGVDVTALCDIDETVLKASAESLANSSGLHPRLHRDHETLLADRSIDAVVIATPDHWHVPLAIATLEAGKDLYLEQPVTHSLVEHDELIAQARRSDAVIQTGLPHRSAAHFQSAIELVRSGRLGEIRMVQTWAIHRRRPLGTTTSAEPPKGVDYARWLGPATERPFSPNRFHHNWHFFWDYGSGELGRSGVLLLDVAAWGLGLDRPERVSATGGKFSFDDEQETPDTLVVHYGFPRVALTWEHRQWSPHGHGGRNAAVSFCGEDGTLTVDRGGWKVYGHAGNLSAPASPAEEPHLRDWINAIRTRTQPTADLETGLTAVTLCHLGNMAYRQGRELRFDG